MSIRTRKLCLQQNLYHQIHELHTWKLVHVSIHSVLQVSDAHISYLHTCISQATHKYFERSVFVGIVQK